MPCKASEAVVRYSRLAFASAGRTVISGDVAPFATCRTPDGMETDVATATVTPLDQPPMMAATLSVSTIWRAACTPTVGRVVVSTVMYLLLMGPPTTTLAALLI